jgi:molybdopterin converting factor small subunit
MKVRVYYLGPVRVRLNKREEDIDITAKTSILDLLKGLSDVYGDWFRKEVLDDEGKNVREGTVITVNGIASGQLGGLTAQLKDGDEVMLLPFFAGGG